MKLLHIQPEAFKTLCGLNRLEPHLHSFDAIHIWYYHFNQEAYVDVNFCPECKNDPRIPLLCLKYTDL